MEEISKRPIVVILNEITKREIGSRNGVFVYVDNKQTVEQSFIDDAVLKQSEYLIDDTRDVMNKAIKSSLDAKAQELRYDNMMSARSYAGYENAFQEESTKLAIWASDCWVKAGEIEADVASGDREMPTVDEVLAELPSYE